MGKVLESYGVLATVVAPNFDLASAPIAALKLPYPAGAGLDYDVEAVPLLGGSYVPLYGELPLFERTPWLGLDRGGR